MYFCKNLQSFVNMLSRINEVLHSAANVIAPPPTIQQDFEYHWKQVKCFYGLDPSAQPKCHVNDTNIPFHLQEMLQILISEELDAVSPTETTRRECLDFVMTNRPLDLFADVAVTDSPPGITVCILNWIRRFLSCLRDPKLYRESIYQPVQRMVGMCHGDKVSPYEAEEILFLATVAGLIRKDPYLIHLFLPPLQHSAFFVSKIRSESYAPLKCPTKNQLFESNKVEANIRRIAIVHDSTDANAQPKIIEDAQSIATSRCTAEEEVLPGDYGFTCNCDKDDRLRLLDTILEYFDSPDNVVIVRACEGALVLTSLPSVTSKCVAIRASLNAFSIKLACRLVSLCLQIPSDMDTGDIEDCTVSWGLVPRDSDQSNFIGGSQLNDFLCWLDYSNCLSIECPEMARDLCYQVRKSLLEDLVGPSMLDQNAAFMLVLAAKVVRLLGSQAFSDEIANWIIGHADLATTLNDSLLTILIENAYENSDILLPTLQFIESLLDNTNERILHSMIFRYLNTRGYYNSGAQQVQSWSDEEDEREKRGHARAEGAVRSKTMAPTNILKVINNFLLLLPRQIMCESVGTCYEEYVQDASRHYQNWVFKTSNFNWPAEALSGTDLPPPHSECLVVLPGPSTLDAHSIAMVQTRRQPHCDDSGISEETFYEGPLLRLLFQHICHMDTYAYELNLAVIAILSKLAFLPHPYLHEILLNPEIPITRGTNTLWSSMQFLVRHLLIEVPRIEGFQTKVADTGKRLLTNPPLIIEATEDNDPMFESLVVLEEFCKELAAIAFVKYHQATE